MTLYLAYILVYSFFPQSRPLLLILSDPDCPPEYSRGAGRVRFLLCDDGFYSYYSASTRPQRFFYNFCTGRNQREMG
jgi:hypothetical protein